MAASDAKPIPTKNAAYRVTFPILDADGDLVAGATGLDSEFSEDAATFADCSNEATEIATSSGMYYLDVINTEMGGDTVAIIVKSSTGKTTPIVMYPQEAGDINVNVETISGDATAADNCELFFDGTGYNASNSAVGTVASVTAIATGGITAGSIAADAIGASELAADAVAEIADAVWDEDATGHQTQGTFGQAIGDPVADTNTIFKAVVTDATGATVGADVVTIDGIVDSILADTGTDGVVVASINANAVNASALASDAVDEIWNKAMSELGSVPGVTASVLQALEWVFLLSRNKITQTATTQTLRNDADAGNIGTAAVSDDGTTATRAEWA